MEHLEPGWYPDPQGADTFRYWDGVAWSTASTHDPGDPPPRRAVVRTPRRPGPTRLIVAIVSAVAALAVIGGLTLAGFGAPDESGSPAPTRVGTAASDPYDQSSSPGPQTPVPTRSPTTAEESIACPRGNPNVRAKHPRDDRVHGGGWSFPEIDGFDPAAPESRLTFAWDVTQQVRPVSEDPSWIAQVAVGELRSADGFDRDAQRTADEVMDCVVSSDLYGLHSGARRDTGSAAVEVDGRAGWRIESDIVVDRPGLAFPGDHVTIIVAPKDEGWSLFFAATPLGDTPLARTVGETGGNLRVD